MIPSGYKEDVVYSQIPTNGNGDLSFTRASNGTRVNSAGLVEVCPWNNCTNTETFSSTWTALSGASVTANNTTAPNGTNTGARLAVPSTAFAGFIQTIPDNTQTLSIYAKKGTLDYLWIIHENISQLGASFNLDTGVVSFVASGHNASMESVGNGWYRCILSTTNSATWDYFQFGLSNASNSAASPSGGNAYIWGAQANIGATAKPYFPTTDRLNVPRLTYQNGGGGCPSLLLEKQSTNYIIQSENFTTFWSFANLLYTANQAISPDGTQNATKLSDTNGTGQHRYFQYVLGSLTNQTLSFSIYAKQGTHRYISWGITDDSDYRGQVVVDLQTGTITDQFTASATLSNLSVVSQGNGWYRISGTIAVSSNYSGGNAYGFGLMLNSSSWSTAGYTGNDTNFYAWGAQVEQSSYPTSYIPTTSSSATRVADACFKTGISSLIGQTEGVLFWDINFVADGTEQTINISDGTNFIYLQKYSDNKIYTGVYNGSFVGSVTSSVLTSGRKKIAFGYILNSLVLYINGVSIGTDLTSTIPTCDRLSLTVSNTGSIETNNFILFPTKLTNAELASLTTI